jgi:hypothetical protein
MDIIIAVDFIKKFATKKETKYAANLIENFIKKRSSNFDYYCIFMNSVVEEKNIDDGTCWNPAVLSSGDAKMYKYFDRFFFTPTPNLSVCFRQSLNPYEQSNPPFSVIMDAIKDSKFPINKISILPSSKAQDAEIIKESILENFEIEPEAVAVLDFKMMLKLHNLVKKI